MSRILILLLFVVWLGWKPTYPNLAGGQDAGALTLFLGVYAVLVLLTGLWSRLMARRLPGRDLHRSLSRFNRVIFTARVFIPIWFICGMLLGWHRLVSHALHDPSGIGLTQTIVGVVIGTSPAFLAWVGLWWSQYPAERALREQSLLSQLEADLPIHSPPTFGSYVAANLRLQLLFMVVPVMMIVLLHDLLRMAVHFVPPSVRLGLDDPDDPFTWLGAAAFVFLMAPEILRRVLHTEPLPDTPLRRRLEMLCRRTGVRYREILLWRTQNNMGNAAVMGFVPRLRYILLSDLLLETMTDEQIEAVFAHELGHIVHRHMAWYLVFIVVLSLFSFGTGKWAQDAMESIGLKEESAQALLFGTMFVVKFLILFGFVSRRFERQADVFAARTIEDHRLRPVVELVPAESLLSARQLATVGVPCPSSVLPRRAVWRRADPGHVGEYGATLFGSALHRVAVVNNIPVKARSWCHGSIAKRMEYLAHLSRDPLHTARFDRFMLWLYGSLVFALFASAAYLGASFLNGGS